MDSRRWLWRVERVALGLFAVWAGAPALVALLFPQTVVRFISGAKPLSGPTAVVAMVELGAMRLGLALVCAWAASLRRPPRACVWAVAVAIALGVIFLHVAVAAGSLQAPELHPHSWVVVDAGLALTLLVANTLRMRRLK